MVVEKDTSNTPADNKDHANDKKTRTRDVPKHDNS